jgi:hypothetical protein
MSRRRRASVTLADVPVGGVIRRAVHMAGATRLCSTGQGPNANLGLLVTRRYRHGAWIFDLWSATDQSRLLITTEPQTGEIIDIRQLTDRYSDSSLDPDGMNPDSHETVLFHR